MKTIPETFFVVAGQHPQKPALLYKKKGKYVPVSYGHLSLQVKKMAAALRSMGVGKGDTVAILSENRPEWVVYDLAAMSIGAIVAPIHTTFNGDTIVAILNHCQAKVLMVSTVDLLAKIPSSGPKLTFLQQVIFLGNVQGLEKVQGLIPAVGWQEAMAHQHNIELDLPTNEHAVCTVIYTSGTTGSHKGVLLTHDNILSNIEAVQKEIPIRQNDLFLSFLPLSHVFERMAGYYLPLLFGATIAYAESVKKLPENLREVRPTILVAVPRIFEKTHDAIWTNVNRGGHIAKKLFVWAMHRRRASFSYKIANMLVFRKVRKRLGGRLRLAVSGGAALSEHLGKFFRKIGILIIEGYGLTETSPVIAVNREAEVRFGTVGRALSNLEVKIGPDKEILVRGPSVFRHYLNDSEGSASVLDSDRWFHTGDLGFLDKDGFLTIIGRKKDMFVLSGGKNIWPERIENMLNGSGFISQSMVVGNDEKFVSALIVPYWKSIEMRFNHHNLQPKTKEVLAVSPDVRAVFQEVIDHHINPFLSDFEKIKKFILLPMEFSHEHEELTPTLKLRRHIILRRYEKEIAALYKE